MMNGKKQSRRTFLKHTAIASEAAGLTILGAKRVRADNRPLVLSASNKIGPFKIGILGCGNRSKAHFSALNDVPDVEIAAMCDVVPQKLERSYLIRKGPEPRKYSDMEEMVKQDDLDAIAVILPNYMHRDAAIMALEAGKHVFCEKPMAITVSDCNAMIAAAERARKALQIGTQRRHGSDYKTAVETIRNAPIGRILSSDVNSYRQDWRVPRDNEYPKGVEYWRLDQAKCGGVVYEMGAHIIDANNWIFDSEPMTVACLQGVNNLSLRTRDSADHGGVLVRYANGAMMNYGGNLYTYGLHGANYFFAVNGTVEFGGGQLAIKYGEPRGISSQGGLPKPINKKLPSADGTTEQWNHFARVLAGEADPYPDGYIGRQTIQICEGSVVSAREKTIVDVRELG
ncbi:hypothetical protein GF373_10760 [bacterium]|nr:hypothetical protein [bacterium]